MALVGRKPGNRVEHIRPAKASAKAERGARLSAAHLIFDFHQVQTTFQLCNNTAMCSAAGLERILRFLLKEP